jgi:hypothetical protein
MEPMRGLVRSIALLALLGLPGVAMGAGGLPGVEQAREAHGATKPPGSIVAGAVTVTPTEGIASVTRSVEIQLRRGTAVNIDLPARFSRRGLNGRAFVDGTPASAALDSGATLSLDVSGLPAGTYRLPLHRNGALIGTAVFRLYSASREGDEAGAKNLPTPFGRLDRAELDTSQDATEESETFIAVDPADVNRIVTSANDISASGLGGVSVSIDGGATWAHPTFPVTFRTGALPANTDIEIPSGDPILAADTLGNVWAGGLSTCTAGSKSHIFVNRLAPGATDFGTRPNVAIPALNSGGTCGTSAEVTQDKPQMTIDNGPISPTKGRLYVTWDDPDPSSPGAINEVLAYCDTATVAGAAFCDNPANWKGPAVVSDSPGSYITSDPAVGPDGKVYVAWWDYSATNAIAIDSCTPATTANRCDRSTDWGTDKIVASLSTHLNDVPFACSTLAQPGGRAAPVPSLAVDTTTGANAGRIYVAWSDLGSTGSTRCSASINNATGRLSMSLPDSSQDAWNSYVASAPDLATLTSDAATTSGQRGTNIIGDPGDHWFPWVAVDQSTGQAYVDLYSTRDDATRRSANFYVRAVVPGPGTQVSYGALTKASDEPTNYSDQRCGNFGNDYGDYTGLAAAGGFAFPVWTHRVLGGDGDVYIDKLPPGATSPVTPADNPALPPPSAQLAQCLPPPPPPPPPPPTTTTTTTTPPPPPPPIDRKPPTLKVTYSTRVDRKGRYTLRFKAAGEPATGRATLRLATGKRRKLVSGVLATSGRHAFKLSLRLRSKDFRLLRRKHRLRVRLTVGLTDKSRNSAHSVKVFTLRPSRR